MHLKIQYYWLKPFFKVGTINFYSSQKINYKYMSTVHKALLNNRETKLFDIYRFIIINIHFMKLPDLDIYKFENFPQTHIKNTISTSFFTKT